MKKWELMNYSTDKIIYLINLNIDTHRTIEENIALYKLQNILQQFNYQVEIIDAWIEDLELDDLVNKLESNKTMFIGVTGCLANINEIKMFLDKLKKNIPVVIGGYGGTFDYERILELGVYIVALGEGESTIVYIAKHFSEGYPINEIPNIAYCVEGNIKLNKRQNTDIACDNPLIERKYLEKIIESKATINIYTSKGCSGNCIFCSISKFYGKQKWKSRPKDVYLDELEFCYKNGGRTIKFIDDSFIDGTRDIAWVKKFKKSIIERGMQKLRFRISIKPEKVTNEIIENLKSAGLFAVSCGIENFSKNELIRMNKYDREVSIDEVLGIFKENDIYVQTGFILFNHQTTMEDLECNLNSLKKHDNIIIKGVFSEMYAAKGTPYFNLVKRTDLVTNEVFGNLKYKIMDKQVQKIYDLLRVRHLNFAETYDKLIDPISAPKSLEEHEYASFMKLYKKVYKYEVNRFAEIIKVVKAFNDEKQICHVNQIIADDIIYFDEIRRQCEKLYIEYEIPHKASKNKFI